MSRAVAIDAKSNCTAPGALVVNSAFTVSEIMPRMAAASTRPRATPSTEPASPSIAASPRNIASTPLELVPMARKIPISVRRRTTLTAIVL